MGIETLYEGQPSNSELEQAWTAAIECEGLGGIHSNLLLDLRELRNKRTTWSGKDENNLRYSLDNYLRHYFKS